MKKMILVLLLMLLTATANATDTAQFLEVKEAVIFKNGFAYLRCEGKAVPVNGQVILDEIPDASLGAFWGASLTEGVPLKSIKAQKTEVFQQETIVKIEDLIKSNTGEKATIQASDKQELKGTLVGFQYYQQPAERLENTDRNAFYGQYGYYPNFVPQPVLLEPRIEWVTLKTGSGVTALRVSDIRSISIEGEKAQTSKTTSHTKKELVLDFGGGKTAKEVEYTLFFVIKGIRWIPDYKIELIENNQAKVKLSATILNEVMDIRNASVRLMVGYPRIAFGEQVTPLTLRDARQALSGFFGSQATGGQGGLSNIAVQAVAEVGYSRSAASLPEETPLAESGEGIEDFYGFEIKNVTLAKGSVMLVPVSENKHAVEHYYELESWSFDPFLRRGNIPQELMSRVLAPDWDRVWHKLVVMNQTAEPITTAPATIFKQGQMLVQEKIDYSPPRGRTVMPVTIASDILSTINEIEASRQNNAITSMGRSWDMVTVKGTILVTNKKKTDVSVTVKRHVLGKVAEVSSGGRSEASAQGWENLIKKLWEGVRRDYYGSWWNYYGYYQAINPISCVEWTKTLKPDEKASLEYTCTFYEYR